MSETTNETKAAMTFEEKYNALREAVNEVRDLWSGNGTNRFIDRMNNLSGVCVTCDRATEPPQAPAGLPWRKGGKLGGEMPGDGRIYLRIPSDYLDPYAGNIYRGRVYISYLDGAVDWSDIDWWLPASELTATIPTPHSTDQE